MAIDDQYLLRYFYNQGINPDEVEQITEREYLNQMDNLYLNAMETNQYELAAKYTNIVCYVQEMIDRDKMIPHYYYHEGLVGVIFGPKNDKL